jgi:hypothetical protein
MQRVHVLRAGVVTTTPPLTAPPPSYTLIALIADQQC